MIIPAILEDNLEAITDKVKTVDEVASLIQIDVCEKEIVGSQTFLAIKELDKIETDATFELDLMVQNPAEYVNKRLGSTFKVCANIKALDNIPDFIIKAKENEYITGISVNPDTPLDLISPLVGKIDYVQFMGVKPGSQGQKFNKKVIEKIKEFLKEFPYMDVQVDGGLDETIIKELMKVGVKNFVVGSAIFNNDEPLEAYKKLKETARDTTNNIFGE